MSRKAHAGYAHCRSVRRDESSATVRCHYLRDGTASFAFTIGRAEYFVPVGVLLKCFLEVSDRELFCRLLALIPQDPSRIPTPPITSACLNAFPFRVASALIALRLRPSACIDIPALYHMCAPAEGVPLKAHGIRFWVQYCHLLALQIKISACHVCTTSCV